MTFSEAINVKNANIDKATGITLTHSEVYSRAIAVCGGLPAVIPYIPYSLEEIKNALEHHDIPLNTLPLKGWDFAANRIRDLCARKQIHYMSLSQGVCLLKEAARQWVTLNI